jgi:hypothetical protein
MFNELMLLVIERAQLFMAATDQVRRVASGSIIVDDTHQHLAMVIYDDQQHQLLCAHGSTERYLRLELADEQLLTKLDGFFRHQLVTERRPNGREVGI